MRTFDQALALARSDDPRVGFTMPGRGSTRYVRFIEWSDDIVDAFLSGTRVVTFRRSYLMVRTGGYTTLTTGEAIGVALDSPRAFTTIHRVPYVLGHRMTEGIMLDYAGRRLPDPTWEPYAADWLNQRLSPLASARRANLAVTDVSEDPHGLRVTVRDWTYDGRNRDVTARNLARAYVGRPTARTHVVKRDHYPTREEPLTTILVSPSEV